MCQTLRATMTKLELVKTLGDHGNCHPKHRVLACLSCCRVPQGHRHPKQKIELLLLSAEGLGLRNSHPPTLLVSYHHLLQCTVNTNTFLLCYGAFSIFIFFNMSLLNDKFLIIDVNLKNKIYIYTLHN